MHNRLGEETSPYLRQHAGHPVHWQPWDGDVLAQARDEDRPILLSIGYSACHWCHVMAHECFEDPDVAAVMNALFVNIKVDREERPDLDQIYQLAHQWLTGRPGGWPLTMFLTPEGKPFAGGTYFPKSPRHGLPGFADLCQRVAGIYRNRREDIERQNGALLADLMRSNPSAQPGPGANAATVVAARAGLLRVADRHWGGFGSAPKFPHPTDLALLLRQGRETGDADALDVVRTTLHRMAEGGIHDQIGGGFCRYSVDERWEIPHFEKMLYDNGPLLALYADAWVQFGDPAFAAAAEGMAAWVMDEMQLPAGGYAASLDADSEGEEGRYYVWTSEEIRSLLDDGEWAVAASHWGLEAPSNFEGHWHLRQVRPIQIHEQPRLASARRKLQVARARRVRPGRDDKVLTSWNALMIQGMVRAARIFGRDDWCHSARRALTFIREQLWLDGRLQATLPRPDGRRLGAYLDDHAFLLAALLEMMQADFRPDDLAWARQVADGLLDHFEDGAGGGFFFTAHDHERLIHRTKPIHDNATPAGNGVAIDALQRFGTWIDEPRYRDAADRGLQAFGTTLGGQPGGCASLIDALASSLTPLPFVVLRGPAAALDAWKADVARLVPTASILPVANEWGDLPGSLNKPPADRVNAWACRGVTCLPPVTTVEALCTALGNGG